MKIVAPLFATIVGSSAALFLAAGAAVAHEQPAVPPKAPADHAQMTDSHDMKGMHDMQMSGDQDYDFAAMMRKHHQKALEMAKKELREGNAPQLKDMAQKIVDAQTKEIAELDDWLAKNKPATK